MFAAWICQSLAIVEDVELSLESCCGEMGVTVREKLKKVLSSNPDLKLLKTVKDVLCGRNVKDMEFDLTLSQISSLK